MKNSKIEWCDHTVNFWWGCSEVSAACRNCYARTISKRFGKDCWGKKPRIFRLEKAAAECLNLNDSANRRGVVETVFVNSMSDFFDVDVAPEIRIALWRLFVNCENLRFMVLTKRANVMANHIDLYADKIPPNVHFGITAENQKCLNERMAVLEKFGRKVFLSCEPLLEEIDISSYLDKIDWVICGGETGRNARYFNPMWAQNIFEQIRKCGRYPRERASAVPFFFKKFGDNKANVKTGEEWHVLTVREYPQWHSKGGVE